MLALCEINHYNISMMKKISGKVKAKQIRQPNEMHLEVQIKTKANVFKPKKGKGSFRRNPKHKGLDNAD